MLKELIGTAALALALATPALAELKVGSIAELSGAGAAAGTNFHDGVEMGFGEINAAGGILGEKVELLEYDSQTDPQISRAMVQKAVDDGVFALTGTVFSSSTVVNMLVAQQVILPMVKGMRSWNFLVA